jgi:DNA ligase (NAD+)
VSETIMSMKSIPRTLAGWAGGGGSQEEPLPAYVEVRGEVYLSKQAFLEINQARQQRSLEVYSTARNAASGELLSNNKTILYI